MLKQYMLGGAALGGSAALLTSMINYLKHMKEMKDDTSRDDDVLYVYKDEKNREKKAGLEGGVALAGGALSTLGAYQLVKQLYSAMRESEAQKALDEAQHVFLRAQGYNDAAEKKDSDDSDKKESKKEREKKAGREMSTMEALTSAPIAIPLLLALSSGVATHALLNQYYPVKKKKVKAPRRIEVISPEEAEEYEKLAGSTMEDDAAEFLMRMTHANPVENSDFQNITKAAAMGGLPGIIDTAYNIGFPETLDMVKGASAHAVDPVAEHLAISFFTKSSAIGAQVRLLAAAEFAEQYPGICKQAASMDENTQKALFHVAAVMGNAIRTDRSIELGFDRIPGSNEKRASKISEPELEQAIMDAIQHRAAPDSDEQSKEDKENPKGPHPLAEAIGLEDDDDGDEDELLGAKSVTAGDSTESSDTSGEEAGIDDPDNPSRLPEAKKQQFVSSAKTSRNFMGDIEDDQIDTILSSQ